MASVTELTNFAQTMGIPYYVGAEFAGEHGGRLPTGIAELEAWGNSTGRHNPDGSWVSKPVTGSGNGGGGGGGGGGGSTTPPASEDLITQITSMVKANPILAGIIAYFILKKL